MNARKGLSIGHEHIPIVIWRADTLPPPAHVMCKEKTVHSSLSVLLCGRCRIPATREVICWAKLAKAVPPGEMGVVKIGNMAINGVTGADVLVQVNQNSIECLLAPLTLP